MLSPTSRRYSSALHQKTFDTKSKILDSHHQHLLLDGFNLGLSNHPESQEQLLVDCMDTLKYGHPRYFNQLSSGLDMIGLAVEWWTPTANTNMEYFLDVCNQMQAGYLFQSDKLYNIDFDTGDKTIQCGRHVDIFKLWLMWKAKPEFTNVCFWYFPPRFKHIPEGLERDQGLHKIAPKIKAQTIEEGTDMISYPPLFFPPNGLF